ncbi:MAG: hypothetical protein U1E87_00165 [Alphaproteobacteria bacterium]
MPEPPKPPASAPVQPAPSAPIAKPAPSPTALKPAATPPANPAQPPEANSIADAIRNAKLLADVRYRFEYVDQDGFADAAEAHTVRARLGFQTAKLWGWQILAEGEAVAHMNENFNDTINGKVGYPTVADPEDIQINRLQVDYSGIPGNVITAGRQRINLDNQRFIGGVAFRQNEQTFDAARIVNTYIANLTATYIYLNRVNRVFGEDSNQGSFTGDTHLANVAYDIRNWGRLSAYGYFLDLSSSPALSTETFGVRFAGRHALGNGLAALYAGEYARQKPYADNPGAFELDYWQGEAGLAVHDFKLLAGQELLEGDGTRGFSTPLATLHKFQGFADVFLTTPANGIKDRYGTLGYETKLEHASPVTGVMAAITYHDFEAERGGASFGKEVDAELVVRIGKHWSVGAKYADYQGDGAFADRSKFWIPIEFTY